MPAHRCTTVVAGAAVLLGTLGAGAGTTGAAPSTIPSARFSPATPTSGGTVVVQGRIWKRHGSVVVERREGRRWWRVGRTAVRHHHFALRVHQDLPVVGYRARAGHRHSRTFVLHAQAPTPPTGATVPPAPASSGTSTRSADADACGPRPVKPNGELWLCTFDDEFDGDALDRTKWLPQTSFVTGTTTAHACYVDDPGNVTVADGALLLTVRRLATPVACADARLGSSSPYTAGSVMTYRGFSQQYGRFEVRMKVAATTARGLQEDFWMWPDDRFPSLVPWPAAGEIDVAELYSQFPRNAIPFLHYTIDDNGGPVPGTNTSYSCLADRGVYNTYTLEWDSRTLAILVNGRSCLVNRSGDPAFHKRYILALTAALGTGTNALTAATPLPATTSVDYVRVWR